MNSVMEMTIPMNLDLAKIKLELKQAIQKLNYLILKGKNKK